MITTEILVRLDGTFEEREVEVADNYFDHAPVPEPTEEEKLRADVDYLAIMTGVEL